MSIFWFIDPHDIKYIILDTRLNYNLIKPWRILALISRLDFKTSFPPVLSAGRFVKMLKTPGCVERSSDVS